MSRRRGGSLQGASRLLRSVLGDSPDVTERLQRSSDSTLQPKDPHSEAP
jgi:hypothetical protein